MRWVTPSGIIAAGATPAPAPTASASIKAKSPFRLSHTAVNCANVCSKNLNPANAIGKIKELIIERQVSSAPAFANETPRLDGRGDFVIGVRSSLFGPKMGWDPTVRADPLGRQL